MIDETINLKDSSGQEMSIPIDSFFQCFHNKYIFRLSGHKDTQIMHFSQIFRQNSCIIRQKTLYLQHH